MGGVIISSSGQSLATEKGPGIGKEEVQNGPLFNATISLRMRPDFDTLKTNYGGLKKCSPEHLYTEPPRPISPRLSMHVFHGKVKHFYLHILYVVLTFLS